MGRRGIALVLSFIVIAVLTVLGLAVISRSVSERSIAVRYAESTQAFWLAEAGVSRALDELRDNFDGLPAGNNLWNTALGGGGYYVDLGAISGSSRTATVHGFIPFNAPFRAERIIQVDIAKTLPFWYALFGDEEVKITGSAIIDSYNSSQGQYIGNPIQKNGDLGTNSASSGHVRLTGSVIVYGDVIVGPGGNPNSVISTSGSIIIDGQKMAAASVTALPEVNVPAGVTNSGDLKLTAGQSLTLPAGSYWYSSIDLSGGATLSTSGNVTIYVDGKMKFSGSSVSGANNEPPNLTIIALGDEEVKFSGSNTLRGALYAPDSEIKITTSLSSYGAIIGKEVELFGSGLFHYDEALNQAGQGSGTVGITSWKEAFSPY